MQYDPYKDSPGLQRLRAFRVRLTKFAVIAVLLAVAVFGYMRAVDDFQARVEASTKEQRA